MATQILPGISLPEDPEIAKLPTQVRDAVGAHWLGRAQGELSTASVFAHVVQGLLENQAEQEVLWLAARAVSDEVQHAAICRAVAERYLGKSVDAPPARTSGAATFGDAPARINRLLFVVLQSCINEGIATAFLQQNLALARSPLVRAAIRAFLKDDVQHARIGWAHLASRYVTPEDRAHVARALPTLLRLAGDAWLGRHGDHDVDYPEHGCLGTVRLTPIVHAALQELILPGFEHVGIETNAGWLWFNGQFNA